MKLLITGASGFIGKNLMKAAIKKWGVGNVIALTATPNLNETSITFKNHQQDLGLTNAEIERIQDVDVIIHAGAYTPKSAATANAINECNSNVTFTNNLLSIDFKKLSKIIFTSTLDVYKNTTPISESSVTGPSTLYGWSKLYCEQIIANYAQQKSINSHTLRIGHVYGPGEEQYQKFLPKTIGRILAGEEVELYGDGSELRSFIYIDDVVSAILASVELAERVDIINIVGGHTVSIKNLLYQLISISGRDVQVKQKSSSAATRDFIFDTTLIKKYLLATETDFELGLKSEIEYFEAIK
jgi:UDP-glucose 4-epimerase